MDNASPDDDTRRICREFAHVRLIERPHNGGFGTRGKRRDRIHQGPLDPGAQSRRVAGGRRDRRAWPSSPTAAPGSAQPGRCSSTRWDEMQRSTITAPAQSRCAGGVGGVPEHSERRLRRLAHASQASCATARLTRSSCREPRCSFGARRSTRLGGSMRASSCTARTPISAPGFVVQAGASSSRTRARFVHLGAGSTHAVADRMYIELLRSWLRLIAKRKGTPEAERARRWLLRALRVRALWARGPQVRMAVAWLCIRPCGRSAQHAGVTTPSPLELLHPAGRVERVLLLGRALCLMDAAARRDTGEPGRGPRDNRSIACRPAEERVAGARGARRRPRARR